MKIAVTFFGKKKHTKDKRKEYINTINFKILSIKNYQIIISLLIGVAITMNINEVLCFTSNMYPVNVAKPTKREILALNNVADTRNYMFSEKKEEEKETIPDELLAMDKVVAEYKEQMVFNSASDKDIQIFAENNLYQKLNVCGVDITNYSTNRNIDFKQILNSKDKYFSKASDTVLLYTTHTSESYANSEKYKFEYTSPRRSVDGNYNMLFIASTFAQNLNSKGINTICSLTPHDYGEYNSAYSNSRQTVTTLLSENPNVKISIDVHRDAIEDLDFAPKVTLKGYNVASVMLVMGIGYDGEENPYYFQNLKLALEIQMLANKIYPGLFRPMIIRNSVYNQDLCENSFLIEVGASGNTIEEATLATRCLSNLLNILYSD